jgi:UDP-N-acetylglucosamine enolpyruvyl transferase
MAAPWTGAATNVRSAPNTVVVRGGRQISGTVETSGFKHSLVTAVAAACLGQTTVRIDNCPAITEATVLAELVRAAGGSADLTGSSLLLDASGIATPELDPGLVAAIHGSVYLAPALLVRFGSVTVPGSGGCRIGSGAGNGRPVEHYVDVLGRFGATASVHTDGGFTATADALRPTEIDLFDYTEGGSRSGPCYSGATKVAVLAAAGAKGISVLRNPYPKPDVTDMIALLTLMGADIEQPGDDLVVVNGDPDRLRLPTSWTLLPDLMEIVTWICVGATVCPDGLTVTGPQMRKAALALAPEIAVLDEMGVPVEVGVSSITTRPPTRPAVIDVTAASHGVFSDSQPFIALLACAADGVSHIRDTVWTRRFGYADQLNRLGTTMRQSRGQLSITGPRPPFLSGQRLSASDLRAAAVLLIAALQVPGRTDIDGLHHLARGYADLPGELVRLGAEIDFP